MHLLVTSADDGSTANERTGQEGFLFLPGEDGADRFYTMYLYSWGPGLYYFDVTAKALALEGQALKGQDSRLDPERLLAAEAGL